MEGNRGTEQNDKQRNGDRDYETQGSKAAQPTIHQNMPFPKRLYRWMMSFIFFMAIPCFSTIRQRKKGFPVATNGPTSLLMRYWPPARVGKGIFLSIRLDAIGVSEFDPKLSDPSFEV